MHGGLSTGPKTAEGRVRIAEAQRRRWSAYRQEKAESSPSKPPAKVRVVSPYSYYADDGQLRSWWAGRTGDRRSSRLALAAVLAVPDVHQRRCGRLERFRITAAL